MLRRKSPLSTILTTKPHSEVRRPSSLLDRVVDVGASLAEDWDVRADFLDGGYVCKEKRLTKVDDVTLEFYRFQ